MIFDTSVPLHQVFDADQRPGSREQQASFELSMEGRTVVLEPVTKRHAVVSRLISSDPADYLDPRWQPGTEWDLYQFMTDG